MEASIKVTGFGTKHKLKDADGKTITFSQNYKYIPMNCPRCKKKVIMLYPALNKCDCGCIIGFCALNDGENRLGTFDIDKLKEMIE